MKKNVTILLMSIALTSPCTSAADQAPVVPGPVTHGCLVVPTSISFNADCHACERFNITCSCPIDYYSVEIFDRWGTKVFVSYDIHKQWDGSMGSSYLPVGCYSYVILYRETADSALKIYKGTVLFLH